MSQQRRPWGLWLGLVLASMMILGVGATLLMSSSGATADMQRRAQQEVRDRQIREGAERAARAQEDRERAAFAALDAHGHLAEALKVLGPPSQGVAGAALARRHLDAMINAAASPPASNNSTRPGPASVSGNSPSGSGPSGCTSVN